VVLRVGPDHLGDGAVSVNDACRSNDELNHWVQIHKEPQSSNLSVGYSSYEINQNLLFAEARSSVRVWSLRVEELRFSLGNSQLIFGQPYELEQILDRSNTLSINDLLNDLH